MRIQPADTGVGPRSDLWDYNFGPTGSNQTLNYDLARARYIALFELVNTQIGKHVLGITLSEYTPWLEASWITGNSSNSAVWYQYKLGSGSLYNNSVLESVISNYLLKTWNYCVYCVASR